MPLFTFEEERASVIAAITPVVHGASTCAELAQAIADNMADWRESPDPDRRARLDAIMAAAADAQRHQSVAEQALAVVQVQSGHANMADLLNAIGTAAGHAARALGRTIEASKSQFDDEHAG